MQKVCIVIPCYNEEKRLNTSPFLDYILKNNNVALCFVNDGSKDNTLSLINKIAANKPEQLFVYDLKVNQGKAEAVRMGVLHAHQQNKYEFIGFWDADFPTPLVELDSMLEYLCKNPSCKVLIGSRVKRLGAQINRKLSRHILGRVFSTFSNWILKFPVYDSQCGSKIFHKETIPSIFFEKFITKWIFDVEILARIRNKFGAKKISDIVYEMPIIQWQDVKGSKIKLTDYISIPAELLKIYFRYN